MLIQWFSTWLVVVVTCSWSSWLVWLCCFFAPVRLSQTVFFTHSNTTLFPLMMISNLSIEKVTRYKIQCTYRMGFFKLIPTCCTVKLDNLYWSMIEDCTTCLRLFTAKSIDTIINNRVHSEIFPRLHKIVWAFALSAPSLLIMPTLYRVETIQCHRQFIEVAISFLELA